VWALGMTHVGAKAQLPLLLDTCTRGMLFTSSKQLLRNTEQPLQELPGLEDYSSAPPPSGSSSACPPPAEFLQPAVRRRRRGVRIRRQRDQRGLGDAVNPLP